MQKLLLFIFLIILILPAQASVIKLITVNNIDVRLLTPQLTELNPIMPKGIEAVVGIALQNRLLVRAATPEAMAEFEALIAALDQPLKQVSVELMLIKVGANDTQTGGVTITIDPQGRHTLDFSGQGARHNARIVTRMAVTVASGGWAYVDFSNYDNFFYPELQRLLVRVPLVGANNAVTFQIQGISAKPRAVVNSSVMQAANGQTLPIGSYRSQQVETNIGGAPRGPALITMDLLAAQTAADADLYLYATPTVIPDKPHASFAPFEMPPPMF